MCFFSLFLLDARRILASLDADPVRLKWNGRLEQQYVTKSLGVASCMFNLVRLQKQDRVNHVSN